MLLSHIHEHHNVASIIADRLILRAASMTPAQINKGLQGFEAQAKDGSVKEEPAVDLTDSSIYQQEHDKNSACRISVDSGFGTSPVPPAYQSLNSFQVPGTSNNNINYQQMTPSQQQMIPSQQQMTPSQHQMAQSQLSQQQYMLGPMWNPMPITSTMQGSSVDAREKGDKSSPPTPNKRSKNYQNHPTRTGELDDVDYLVNNPGSVSRFLGEHKEKYTADKHLPDGWTSFFLESAKRLRFLDPELKYVFKSKIAVYKYLEARPGIYTEETLEQFSKCMPGSSKKLAGIY